MGGRGPRMVWVPVEDAVLGGVSAVGSVFLLEVYEAVFNNFTLPKP